MRKFVITAIIAITLAIVPNAFALTPNQRVANLVNHAFAQQVRSRLGLNGFRLLGTTMKCVSAYDGRTDWTCRGTYTASTQGVSIEYACMIIVHGADASWHVQGQPWVIRSW